MPRSEPTHGSSSQRAAITFSRTGHDEDGRDGLDWLFNLTHRSFSNPALSSGPSKHDKMFYFADICAGPGGFTEYVYWRRQQSARGWGFTLRGDHDFRLDKFNSTSPHFNFTPSYGVDDTGNIYSRQNMEHFANKVSSDTGGRGVALVMADGGDSVDGEFLRQEWLMRRLAVCQCCLALQACILVLRSHACILLLI
jgi:cap1 methyltransferase